VAISERSTPQAVFLPERQLAVRSMHLRSLALTPTPHQPKILPKMEPMEMLPPHKTTRSMVSHFRISSMKKNLLSKPKRRNRKPVSLSLRPLRSTTSKIVLKRRSLML